MQLKILSWNIWCDGDFEKTCEFLRASRADIIGLQEGVPAERARDIVSFLSTLGYHYTIAKNGATFLGGRMITVALFSKYPIQKSQAHPLSTKSPREAIEADIVVNGRTIQVVSLHLKHTHHKEEDIQNKQAGRIVKALPKENVVMMGDFNATPGMTPIRRMREVLIDTDPAELPTLNASLFDCKTCDRAPLSTTKLDYIFVSPDMHAHSFKVEKSNASDHLPVSVILEV